MTFNVIDPKIGEYPDLEHIARTEEWAQNLIPCESGDRKSGISSGRSQLSDV